MQLQLLLLQLRSIYAWWSTRHLRSSRASRWKLKHRLPMAIPINGEHRQSSIFAESSHHTHLAFIHLTGAFNWRDYSLLSGLVHECEQSSFCTAELILSVRPVAGCISLRRATCDRSLAGDALTHHCFTCTALTKSVTRRWRHLLLVSRVTTSSVRPTPLGDSTSRSTS